LTAEEGFTKAGLQGIDYPELHQMMENKNTSPFKY